MNQKIPRNLLDTFGITRRFYANSIRTKEVGGERSKRLLTINYKKYNLLQGNIYY